MTDPIKIQPPPEVTPPERYTLEQARLMMRIQNALTRDQWDVCLTVKDLGVVFAEEEKRIVEQMRLSDRIFTLLSAFEPEPPKRNRRGPPTKVELAEIAKRKSVLQRRAMCIASEVMRCEATGGPVAGREP